MEPVDVHHRDPASFAEVVGSERADELATATVGVAKRHLGDRAIVNINSTASGGGVAEMLHVLLGYVHGAGIKAAWLVIDGDPPFFEITKRIHNHLYGTPGDGGPLGAAEHAAYERTLGAEFDRVSAAVDPGDIVILHDPQTAGLAATLQERGCIVVWRCHVGIDDHNEHSLRAWEFLRPYLEDHVDHYVFTDTRFPPPWLDTDRMTVIWPSIDPFAPKNQPMDDATVEAILTRAGIINGRPGDTTFTHIDGTPATVERRCDVIRAGLPPGADVPLVVQVSRWDHMKDMVGVMRAFAEHVVSGRDAELVLAGPSVAGVADDPEGAEVLLECWRAWQALPEEARARVALVCLPMDDLEENAAIVNALQRHATVVTQKSLAEGFGLTVAEAMVKGTPVVGTAVGGIVDQVIDGETGRIVHDPTDLAEFGAAVCEILDDPVTAEAWGAAGRQRALDTHLGDTHLQHWLRVIQAVLPTDPA